MDFYNKHYIRIDSASRIITGFSDAFEQPEPADICISAQGGYQFRLFADGEENPLLCDEHGVPLYSYADGKIIQRTKEELEADRPAAPEAQPTHLELLSAKVDYIAMMGGYDELL